MTTKARIYRPVKNVMQSGRGKTSAWVLEFESDARVAIDPLMGWSGSADTRKQVRLTFPSCKAALAYAKREGVLAKVEHPKERRVKPRSYADNFAFKRVS